MSGTLGTPVDDALKVSSGSMSMTIDPGLGGRILSCSLDGQNILLESSAVAGTDNANNFGATFWPSPQSAWGWPPTPAIDNGAYSARKDGERWILTSAAGEMLDRSRITLTKTFAPVPQQSAIDVTYVMNNVGVRVIRLAAWQIARVRAGGLTFFRLGDGGVTGDRLCTVTQRGVQWYQYDAAVVTEQGQKTFADGTGWLAHVEADRILVQAFADVPMGAAAEGEAEVELYADPSHTYVEIEPQGRVQAIAVGKNSEPWTVRWWLRRLPNGIAARVGNQDLVDFVEALIRS